MRRATRSTRPAPASLIARGRRGATGYLCGRFVASGAKALGFALLAGLNALVARTGPAKKALVRAWRSCGYLYQIPRSFCGKV